MINKDLKCHIEDKISFLLTEEQSSVLQLLVDFLLCTDANSAFLLKGYAGTGKTTLVGAVIRALLEQKQKVVLLAPTGRAAKVFSKASGCVAYTVHRKIYRQRSFDGSMDGFSLNDNLYHDTLFFVDEASMISNAEGGEGGHFGSGCLLDDLVRFVYSGKRCRLILVGDDAQLPPVGTLESPALNRQQMEGYGLHIYMQLP